MRSISGGSLPLSVLNALDMGKRSRGAAMGLLFYDHMITLDLEVDLMWKRNKRQPAFFLYIFNRFFALAYLIFDSIPLTRSGTVSSNVSLALDVMFGGTGDDQFNSCIIYLMCNDLVTLLTTLIVQAILLLRVYALYERSKNVLIFLLALFAVEVGVMATLVGVTTSHLEHLPLVSTDTGCYYRGLLGLSALFWVPGLIYEPILFLFVAYKASPLEHKFPQVPLISRVARDSMLYFIIIFAELLASTIIWAHAPTYINIIMPWSAALPSILGSRLLLNMREMVVTQDDNSYIIETFTVAQTMTLGTSYTRSSNSGVERPRDESSMLPLSPIR